ncbi:MAG: CotH kinase family protein [Flavobacteriales bacterium]|nr:CotH kinase family protein [Flavobacteriales bacterium]
MRHIALWTALIVWALGPAVAQGLLVNEVCPICPLVPGAKGWVELINNGPTTVELEGVVLQVGPYRAQLDTQRLLAPGMLHLISLNPTSDGPHAKPLALSASGGSLLLFAAGGTRMLDAFTWPAVSPGISVGRWPDGGADWSFFPTPGPGEPQGSALPRIHARAPAPTIQLRPGALEIEACEGCEVRYTTDGAPPEGPRAQAYHGPLDTSGIAVLRTSASRSDLLSSQATPWVKDMDDAGVAVLIDPEDLWDAESGLLAEGERANFAREGPAWTRTAQLVMRNRQIEVDRPVALRVSGSGSRSFAKRSFNVSGSATLGSRGQLRLPDSTPWNNLVLRADATPHAMLHNLLATELVHRAGDRLAVQPGTAVPLYLNGAYWGAYRAMPAKNEELLCKLSGAEKLDIVEGAEGRIVRGGRTHYEHAMALLERAAPLDSLAALIDVESLIELACFDLWTGRADADLNMRCYRPAQPGGRWRWVLYDMDLWAPPDDPSVERLCDGHFPSAPYLPQLLGHPELRPLLLARLSTLLATVFSEAQALPLADSLYRAHAVLLMSDHQRWKDAMEVPLPEETQAVIKEHITRRAEFLLRDLARYVGIRATEIRITAPSAHEGSMVLEGIVLTPGKHVLRTFEHVPLRWRAVPAEGMEFAGWKGIDATLPEVSVRAGTANQVQPLFRAEGRSGRNGLQQRLEDRLAVRVP